MSNSSAPMTDINRNVMALEVSQGKEVCDGVCAMREVLISNKLNGISTFSDPDFNLWLEYLLAVVINVFDSIQIGKRRNTAKMIRIVFVSMAFPFWAAVAF